MLFAGSYTGTQAHRQAGVNKAMLARTKGKWLLGDLGPVAAALAEINIKTNRCGLQSHAEFTTNPGATRRSCPVWTVPHLHKGSSGVGGEGGDKS